ncbi:LINE-1 retrotransposable element ORF2 protein [Vitis vinifera]|uniref:LINE-1 retrotransposable element ORF2 protein n=1 Tax=Vitis vinifera TaxID=29760 RepID=A0A438HTK2_VITVI|nr:LINE-1 retrotransposable element ORF2 protein [Vitis vinifera]
MQESPVCKRLDRFLYSNEWGQLFPQGIQETLIRRTSDHWPIALDTNPFTWAQLLLDLRTCGCNILVSRRTLELVEGFQGNGWEGHKFMRRLQFVKAKAKEWNKLSFGVLNEKKKSILKDLANLDAIEQDGGLTSELLGQRALRKGELEELILREEIHWRQKARVKWVKEGDCNSKFFHKVANGRRNRKYIKSLENETGLVLNNAVSITEEILLYFEKLYANPIGESWSIEEEEISKAIFQMDRDKAPGPDGFTIAVFQDCWDVIKEDLVRVLQSFIGAELSIKALMPLSLTFVQGRQIMDAVLIANEIVDERRRSGEEGVVFKIDFEKAYDHVRWDFLDQVLEKKGFSPKWRKWMNGCLSSVSYAVLVNGSAKGWVKASRGLRQGDPLSPFLFTLVADVLSRMLVRAEERNMLEGFRVGRNRTRVSHLQFADDTIFFSNTREEDLQTLKSLLLAFGHISGLKVNLDKSNIYGINLDHAHISRLAETLGCKASGWPILYLGLPLGGNPRAGGFWDPVIERISRRLDVAAKIERLQRDFLWSGIGEGKKDHLVRWDVVCKPKEIGGLGFGNISLRNLALLGKWLWRYPREGSALWHQVILSIYGSHSNGWDANTIVRWSHRCPWKAISQVFQEFSSFTRFVVGNGERIRFWEDLWWGDQPLGSQYPSLFRVVLDKNIPISSVLGPTRPFSWNLNFRRNLSDSEIEDLEGLMLS